jgi:predicted RNA-binding protein Jag
LRWSRRAGGMTVEEARFELSRLTVRQEHLESEILAILNKGCLPLEDAKRKIDELEASGVETETVNGVKCLVEKRTYDGQERRFTILPVWYPQYTAMSDVFENLEMDKAMVKAMKKNQRKNKRMRQYWGIEDEDDYEDGYIAAHEKVFEKVEEYLANKTKIEELTIALNSTVDSAGQIIVTPDDIQKK